MLGREEEMNLKKIKINYNPYVNYPSNKKKNLQKRTPACAACEGSHSTITYTDLFSF